MTGTKTAQGSSRSRKNLNISYVDTAGDEFENRHPGKHRRSPRSSRRDRVHPGSTRAYGAMDAPEDRQKKPSLTVRTGHEDEERQSRPSTGASTSPKTPANVRGSKDLRSPGVQKTPQVQAARYPPDGQVVPDFITQTDANGNATTPRSAAAIDGARRTHPSGPKPKLHVDRTGKLSEDDDDNRQNASLFAHDDPCDSLMDSIRMMCCCFMEDAKGSVLSGQPTLESEDRRPKLLGALHPNDKGKKCLVLDLDETLVHSSFREVSGADFVIPVRIENYNHKVFVTKRPGVDRFLTEMAKHYEIVIYTASLNKYADPLLDLLDPNKVIRARLFRESCVYYEGNYVKDLSLLNRDLSNTIIIDNSPSSYLFHPENAIDCSSFIDDPRDRELDQIGAFLAGVKGVGDVRGICEQWRNWPSIDMNKQWPQDGAR